MLAGWSTLTQAERDAAYNNNAAVVDSPALIERRNAASAAFRKAHPAGLDVPYGAAPRQRFDLFPASSPAAPCLVFIHGGYWQRNTREDFACFAEGIMAHGWSAALPSYTLAPDATLAQIVDEIGAALDWLAATGPQHRLGAGPIVASGWSAGGHLTAMALGHRRVGAGIAISGIFELAPLRDTYLNEKLRLTDSEIATLSPLRLPAAMKPLAISYGTAELPALVEDSRGFHAHRSTADAPGPLIPIAGADHFTILEELRRPDGKLVRAVVELAAGLSRRD
jgi:acetyl esterase/lipase